MERIVELSPDRTLTVRETTEADLPAVERLYDTLSIDDLHLRFFSAARPPSGFVERWFTRTRNNGCGLVAVITSDGESEIVADAGYVLLPDGSGELAITVHPGWRGWLGHYVLDSLVEAAAERGVEALHADVLLENHRMLALLDARGYATVGHPDWNTVRVVIGTRGRIPPWTGPHDRPRILVEVPGGRWHAEKAVLDAGYQVVSCPGPRRGPGGRCPLLEGEACPLADGADAIVMSLAMDDSGRAILDEHRAQHSATPVCLSTVLSHEVDGADPDVDAVVPITRDLEPLLATLQRLTGGPPAAE